MVDRIQEREITFFNQNGHNHDGENSSPVDYVPGSITLEALSPALIEYLKGIGGGGDTNTGIDDGGGLIPVSDLVFETNAIAPGGTATGTLTWAGLCLVRFTRIYMSVESECTLTFYHKPTFLDEDREFRAYRCSSKFLWEGPWVHYDETDSKSVFWKIENTGNQTARFQITLKAGTMANNATAAYVQSVNVSGTADPILGEVTLIAGTGVTLTPDAANHTITISATPTGTVPLARWALAPRRPTTVTSSTTLTGGFPANGYTYDQGNYYTFGTGLQWIKCDFGLIYTVGRVWTSFYWADVRSYNNVKIEGSADDLVWTTLMSEQSGVASYDDGIKIEIPVGLNLRYIRIWQNGNTVDTGNHLGRCLIYVISDKASS
jgi:hypothetical protein